MLSDLDRLVALRLRAEVDEVHDRTAALAWLIEAYGPLLESARHVEFLHQEDQAVGAILCGEPVQDRFGSPEARVLVICEPGLEAAQIWAERCLLELAPDLDEHCTVQVNASEQCLVEPLAQFGFGVAKLDTDGLVDVALERFCGHGVNPLDFGLEIQPGRLEQASAINVLMRDYFLARPEHGWGGGVLCEAEQAELDRLEQERLEKILSHEPRTSFVIVRAGELLGYFSFVPHFDHPFFGSAAGINIVLLPEIQGLGLGKTAYLQMLEQMQAMGIKVLYGRTSNPGVLHIGQLIGRRLRRLILRRDGPFIPARHIPHS